MLTKRVQQLAPSPTLALDAEVKKLQAAGQPVINLGVGEPDFPTPLPIVTAAKKALDDGFTRYLATNGLAELRQAIAEKLKTENGIEYTANEIIVSPGSKFNLFAAFQALVESGDDVLIATPTWSTYIEQVKLAGANPVLIPLEPPFSLTAADLEKHATSHTKAILLNSPANPTGAMIEPAELKKIAELAVTRNWWIIADEIYEKLTYTTDHLSIASISPEVRARTVTINGFSKAFAMTGWRLGYAAAPTEVINAMNALQSQTTSNACSIAQKAALAAFSDETSQIVTDMVSEFASRRQMVLKALAAIPELSVSAPAGAFYVFVSLQKVLGDAYPTSQDWCAALLKKQQLAVVPGEAFCAPGYFRLSYAASVETLEKGLAALRKFIYDT